MNLKTISKWLVRKRYKKVVVLPDVASSSFGDVVGCADGDVNDVAIELTLLTSIVAVFEIV